MELNRILVIEKDETLATKEAEALEEAGYKVVRAADALEGVKKLYESYPDLIVMARELPEEHEEDPYLRVRKASYLPIIVVGRKEYAAELLELGADAYMAREPDLSELVARVRAILRRKMWLAKSERNSGANEQENMMDSNNGNGANYLTSTEFHLATFLVLNKGKLLDYQQLIGEVWGVKGVSIDTLHFYMRRLRQKLQAYFPYPIDIFNYQGVGYCLVDDNEDELTNQ